METNGLTAKFVFRVGQSLIRYADFALWLPSISESPGPEYASRTRMYQGIPGIECTANVRLWDD